jgi:hypothetical protein
MKRSEIRGRTIGASRLPPDYAALHPGYAHQIALIALANFAGLPCSENFHCLPLGPFMQMH